MHLDRPTRHRFKWLLRGFAMAAHSGQEASLGRVTVAGESLMSEASGGLPTQVRIGGSSKTALLEALTERGVQLNQMGLDLFGHPGFTTSTTRSLLAITDTSVADLGLPQGATLQQIVDRAASARLSLCPIELAAHLRLQYTDQPEGFIGHPPSRHCAPPGALTIAAESLMDTEGVPMGFYLRRISGVLWLRGYRSPAEHVWDAKDRFVFCGPAKG